MLPGVEDTFGIRVAEDAGTAFCFCKMKAVKVTNDRC